MGIAAGLTALGLAVYGQVITHDFINYDDDLYVTGNAQVQAGFTKETILWAVTTDCVQYVHPIAWFSHMFDCALWGLNPAGHHLTSLLLHVANTIVLFLVLNAMTKAIGPSAVTAALFAVHPLHVESVAWVAERKDVLYTFFWLGGMAAYARYARRPTAAWNAAVITLFLLALLSKPMAVTFPFVLLLLDWWPLNQYQELESWRDTARRFGRMALNKIPLFVLSLSFSFITYNMQRHGGNLETSESIPLVVRTTNAVVTYMIYLLKTLVPYSLAPFYPQHASMRPAWQIAGASIILVGITAGVFISRRRCPCLAVGWLWYLGTLVPVIEVVQAGQFAYADRYTYVPLVGIFMMAAYGLPQVASRWRFSPKTWAVAGSVVIAALTSCAILQTSYWKDSLTLFQHTLRATRANSLAHNNLGCAFVQAGRTDEAIDQFRQALAIDPRDVNAHKNLGSQCAGRGQWDEAISHFRKAVELRPTDATVHNALGYMLKRAGRTEDAIVEYREATHLDPKDTAALNNLGIAFQDAGQTDQAVGRFQAAMDANPKDAAAYVNLGSLWARQGKIDEADGYFRRAMQLTPTDATIPNNLGVALKQHGRLQEAEAVFRDALRIDPKFATAHANLGVLLAVQGKTTEARDHLTKALELSPNDPAIQRMLSLAPPGQAGPNPRIQSHVAQ